MRYPTVKVKDGWEEAGKQGLLLFEIDNKELLGQSWSMVLWNDEDDPDCFKSRGLEVVKP